MNQADTDKAIQVTREIKSDILHLLSKHYKVCSKLGVAHGDPHTPVIGCIQMAMLSACTEWLVSVGCQAPEAVQITLSVVNDAGRRWATNLTKPKQPVQQ